MSYVIESGIAIRNRPPAWVVVDEDIDDRDVAYRAMVARAHSMQVLYEPHGGRVLRVREVQR